MTSSTSNYRPKPQAESPYDTENSLVSLTIYHERPVNHRGGKSMKYYLKKVSDREHDAKSNEGEKVELEIKRSVKFIENKLKSRYADNRMTSIQIYFNDNRGGTIPETTPNPMLCKLNILSNGDFENTINQEIVATERGLNFLNEIMNDWKWHIQRARK